MSPGVPGTKMMEFKNLEKSPTAKKLTNPLGAKIDIGLIRPGKISINNDLVDCTEDDIMNLIHKDPAPQVPGKKKKK